MGPSSIRTDGTEGTGRAMTQSDLDDVLGAFAEAAVGDEPNEGAGRS